MTGSLLSWLVGSGPSNEDAEVREDVDLEASVHKLSESPDGSPDRALKGKSPPEGAFKRSSSASSPAEEETAAGKKGKRVHVVGLFSMEGIDHRLRRRFVVGSTGELHDLSSPHLFSSVFPFFLHAFKMEENK